MPSRSVVLSPATPSELLSYILAHQTYPTTLLIGSSKQEFHGSLVEDVRQQLPEPASQDDQSQEPELQHPFLQAPLDQLAVSRHIRMVFIPTVTHMRAYLSTFSAADSRIAPPPNYQPENHDHLLIVYGFLALHRDASEWSAQGISTSAAVLVTAAIRNSFSPIIVEPARADDSENMDRMLRERIPLLKGSSRKNDGSWSGRTVEIQRVLARWFGFESHEWEPQGMSSKASYY